MPPTSEADATPEWVRGDLPEGEHADEQPQPAEPSAADPLPDAPTDAGAASDLIQPAEDQPVAGETAGAAEPAAPADDSADAAQPAALAAEPQLAVAEPVLQEPAPAGERPVVMEPSPAAPASAEPGAAPPSQKPKRRSRKPRAATNGASADQRPAESAPPVDYGGLSLPAVVESLLFVADGAVPLAHLAEALEVHPRDIDEALNSLAATYQQRGLSLQRYRDRVQLTTAPAAAAVVERFLGLAALTPLTRAALETLAIIAYQQPVTRPQIEAVRGVNSDSVIKNLLTKGLVEESGRAEGPGRPVLYSTTSEFMQHFGLASLGDLPPLALPGTTAETAAAVAHTDLLKG